ncbi:MAG: hypothetical protein FGM33_08515 [Candidatus Kapabacteria bacterium]|nr:hypothetical protein [Candidatus Kapabacteria bacterium]
MLLCLLLSDAPDAAIDALLDSVHACTPLLLMPARGRIYCGVDDLQGLHAVVRRFKCRAAMAPRRTDALLRACTAEIAGRIDVFDNAEEVPSRVLTQLTELGINDDDAERLRLFGLDTIGRLRTVQERHLGLQFGARAAMLYRFLHDASDASLPLYVPPPQIHVTERFDDGGREPGLILDAARRCCQRAASELGTRQAWRIEVSVLDANDAITDVRSRILRQGAQLVRILWTHVQTLCRMLLRPDQLWCGIGLRLASLRQAETQQIDLFAPRVSPAELHELLRPRYGDVMKQVQILDPWTLMPDRHARIVPVGRSISSDQGAER